MLDTLFGLIPAESRGQQWVAEDLQLINWGGYDGPHRVRFSPTATLLCGGSGSGKSTLMDAYIALMMPHTTPFNGASNGAVLGRPRGQDQRNILSYGRGKLDESRTADGTKVRVLRGDGEDTWTAVAMTWVDHDDTRFTAVRAWYIPASARLLEDTVRVRATINGEFDLRRLEEAAQQHLSDAAVRATGLSTVPTDREFSAKLQATLGIGAAGSGAKAMNLLARIQSGQQITTVDELYKRLVLEEPETLTVADAVVQHFDELEDVRVRMITARQQAQALAPIRGLRAGIEAAAQRMQVIDAIGQFSDPSSLAALWRARRRLGRLREVESELRDRRKAAANTVAEKQALAEAADVEREGLADVLRASGGDRLETAEREHREAARRLSQVQRDRERFDEVASSVGETVTSGRQFRALFERARVMLEDSRAKEQAREVYAEAREKRHEIERELADLESERRALSGRRDNIPSELHQARDQMAHAAGLNPEDIPFVGELIEVRTEFEPWREAFNLALGGFATTMLIDAAHLTDFRSAIDAVRTRARIHYEGVHTGLALDDRMDDRTLPGRLDYRRTPFTGWLQQRLVENFDYLCVDSAEQLTGHQPGLTITGQVARGARGAHGGHGRANVLGFSNERRLAELATQIEDARGRLVRAQDAAEAAGAALDALDDQMAAFRSIRGVTWEQIDVATVGAERDRWASIIQEITAGNPRIAEIKASIEDARKKAAELREQIGRAKQKREQIEEAWSTTAEDVDTAGRTLEAAEDDGRELSPEQESYLDTRFTPPTEDEVVSPSEDLRRFDAALATASQRLEEDQERAQKDLGEQREALERTMASFLERWPNPTLLADPDAAFGDFEMILTDLETSGLFELETEWRDSLLRLSGNDLTNLDSTLNRSLREIRDRIEPINVIMEDLPFYDDDHRLQITIRENQAGVRQRFRRELREVRGAIDQAASDEDREQVYVRMSRLIRRIRRNAPDFADLVDVRNYVRVSAERVDAETKEHVALYDHIGEKSGGESQELIAFIVGAALRYQLGDAGAERPRYAPVFLDEALIKADAHFTRRAIGAWRGLGFQLIIGAPNDKYSAIEPLVDVEYDILKDTHGRSWAKPKVGLPEGSHLDVSGMGGVLEPAP